ncbi:hypothetical protein [Chakrabartyella piscis]|uniref:hypothetical protein n=1 Tax=Chakrabartyella piscis TaxID=2918914 RepID=UPI002958364C|nr:hypothetical protein [Chakrabartyella piscis]
MKTLLIVCATGLVTSTVVHNKIRTLLETSQIQANIVQCKATEISNHMNGVSLIVSAIQLQETYPVPIINAIPILLGKDKQTVEGEIIQCMR